MFVLVVEYLCVYVSIIEWEKSTLSKDWWSRFYNYNRKEIYLQKIHYRDRQSLTSTVAKYNSLEGQAKSMIVHLFIGGKKAEGN